MNPFIQFKKPIPLFLVSLVFACLAFSSAHAVSPTPDGLYPGANVAEGGSGALHNLTTQGNNNTAIGNEALFSLAVGVQNTAVGSQALKSATTNRNTAVGFQALSFMVGGLSNTAVGWRALFKNDADDNTAVGASALYSNTTGINNAATGFEALFNNTTGSENNAVGVFALIENLDGHENNALGGDALHENRHASKNTAIGDEALKNNDSSGSGDANFNTAVGSEALEANIDGNSNTAVGTGAGAGTSGISTGNGNTVVGAFAGQHIGAGGQNIYIGHGVDPGISEDGTIRIGDRSLPILGATSTCFIAGISGKSVGPLSAPVIINAGGQLGTAPSSARFKKDIDPMGETSEVIYSLRPVTFHYKSDETNTPQWGLIAEDVAKVNPDLILLDTEGKPQTVRYEQINAMLLNEFLKEHRKVEALEKAVAEQQKGDAAMRAMLKEQAAQIQKVSAQLELSRPAPQAVLNNR
jgi:hypothetical protein